MYKIIIKNLRLACIIGIRPDERRKKQQVIINLEIIPSIAIAKSDSLQDTIDYSTLNKKIREFVEASKFKLIETLADKIADLCLKDGRIKEVKVLIEKPNALKYADSAGIEVVKTKEL